MTDELRDKRKLKEAEEAKTSSDWDIESCLVDMLNDVRKGELKYKNMVVILMDHLDLPQNDAMTYRHVKTTYREAVYMCEQHKALLLERNIKAVEEY